ncbi:MAG: hypothetical protein LBQ91_00670 [Oscillospiraceae bacterium]|jgi:hypothetical protein|nr:hypothetical protein [Oscillospiraceae bacterium]
MAFLPILGGLAAIAAFIIGVFMFFGACLVVIGVTGSVMQRLCVKRGLSSKSPGITAHNAVSIVLGLMLILTPIGYFLYALTAA